MNSVSLAMRVAAVCGVLLGCRSLPAQNAAASPKAEVVLVKLATPIYPTLTRQARISGDVQLAVEVLEDGSVAPTTVIQGHPVLAQASVDSARIRNSSVETALRTNWRIGRRYL